MPLNDRLDGMSQSAHPAQNQAAPAHLSPQEFAERFQRSARTYWCVAAAVLGSPRDAEDVVQDAACTALGQLDRYERGTRFEAWLTQIVRFHALNRLRSEQKSPRPLETQVLDKRPASASSPPVKHIHTPRQGDLSSDQELFDDDVVQALQQLHETARACLLLKTVMEFDYAEIAAVLNIAEGTVASHLHRARQRMRDWLSSDSSSKSPRSRRVL